eukprot:2466188-Pyramimonas_sp.AAC.1
MVQSGPGVVQAWSKRGPNVVQAWSKRGPSVVQAWSTRCPAAHGQGIGAPLDEFLLRRNTVAMAAKFSSSQLDGRPMSAPDNFWHN